MYLHDLLAYIIVVMRNFYHDNLCSVDKGVYREARPKERFGNPCWENKKMLLVY